MKPASYKNRPIALKVSSLCAVPSSNPTFSFKRSVTPRTR